jgi:hypothetical protein
MSAVPPPGCTDVRLWQQAYDLAQQHSLRGKFCVMCGVVAPCRIAAAAEDAMRRAVPADGPTVVVPVIPEPAAEVAAADGWWAGPPDEPEPVADQPWDPASDEYDPGLTAPAVSPWQPRAASHKPTAEARLRAVGARAPRYDQDEDDPDDEQPPAAAPATPPHDISEPVGARFRRESRVGKRRRR